MSSSAKKVVGIEIEEEAVEMAKENLMLNEINNTEFICGDVLNQVDNLNERPNLIIIDPPRQGIHPKAINKIIDFNPEEFIYISCNPVTLVRDLRIFEDRNYRVKKVKIIDMFPRAGHVEVIVKLEKQ
jgi:tRNA/tmRNA/rRNA uracil-C5-methylase (TrmA/RlmC/RlmD family)